MKQRTTYIVATLGGAAGMAAAFMQTLEKLQLLKHADTPLVCDLNGVFSCSNVLNAWQSSVFGFPNSIMCLVLFTIFTIGALAGWLGSSLSRAFRLTIQGLTLFTLGFALWFLYQSTFNIRALCIYCLICFAGLLAVNWAWLRMNVTDLPLPAQWRRKIQTGISHGADTFGWLLLGLLVGFVLLIKFA